jgi:hypothetical protein
MSRVRDLRLTFEECRAIEREVRKGIGQLVKLAENPLPVNAREEKLFELSGQLEITSECVPSLAMQMKPRHKLVVFVDP